ncbi:HEPN domain-containing protein [Deminuibacter soli]|uniref:HEPN domain-containing protein n=1 Tax=Deminuibacter soli TaxID=2291815 RepID=A0A3E1NMF8_9BACT|nr:hypothetical protein [Deminuibacter soli]RFM29116.1 hypothetical protein DXN05_10210 [Deminuibacter soli]
MKTSTTQPANTQALYQQLTQTITTIVPCYKIYLIGISGAQCYAYNPFVLVDGYLHDEPVYHLAVVIKQNTKQALNEVQDAIENRCKKLADVNALVLTQEAYHAQQQNAHPFATTLNEKAELLYNDDDDRPCITMAEHAIDAPGPTYADRQILVTGFIQGALFYQQRQSCQMAAFLLHQAAEQLYIGLYQQVTGYQLHTHNLDKLRRYTRCLSPLLHTIFPVNTTAEAHLFTLLQRAYVDGRYNPRFAVTPAELGTLLTRLLLLQQLVNSICSKLPQPAAMAVAC